MAGRAEEDLTELLQHVNAGREGAYDALAEAVHAQLRVMAERRLVREFGRNLPGLTVQPTVLADDTFMRLIKQRQKYDSAGHFFAIASQEMRRVLLDYCRRRKAQKRGGGAVCVSLDPEIHSPVEKDEADLEAFDAVLEGLAALDQRKADVVKYRVLWELTIDETAAALGVGHATVERDWAFARVWLAKELERMKP